MKKSPVAYATDALRRFGRKSLVSRYAIVCLTTPNYAPEYAQYAPEYAHLWIWGGLDRVWYTRERARARARARAEGAHKLAGHHIFEHV